MTTGISAPPIEITKCHPKNNERPVMIYKKIIDLHKINGTIKAKLPTKSTKLSKCLNLPNLFPKIRKAFELTLPSNFK